MFVTFPLPLKEVCPQSLNIFLMSSFILALCRIDDLRGAILITTGHFDYYVLVFSISMNLVKFCLRFFYLCDCFF